jgi:hypothetical protein
VRFEQAVYKSLLNEWERKTYYARFNVDGLLRGDYTSRMQGSAIGRQNGWLSANDIRGLEDMNPIDGGDIYLVNGNMTAADDKTSPKTAPNAPQGGEPPQASKGVEPNGQAPPVVAAPKKKNKQKKEEDNTE